MRAAAGARIWSTPRPGSGLHDSRRSAGGLRRLPERREGAPRRRGVVGGPRPREGRARGRLARSSTRRRGVVTAEDIYERVLAIQNAAFVDDAGEEDLAAKLGRAYLLATGLLEDLHAEI